METKLLFGFNKDKIQQYVETNFDKRPMARLNYLDEFCLLLKEIKIDKDDIRVKGFKLYSKNKYIRLIINSIEKNNKEKTNSEKRNILNNRLDKITDNLLPKIDNLRNMYERKLKRTISRKKIQNDTQSKVKMVKTDPNTIARIIYSLIKSNVLTDEPDRKKLAEIFQNLDSTKSFSGTYKAAFNYVRKKDLTKLPKNDPYKVKKEYLRNFVIHLLELNFKKDDIAVITSKLKV